MIASLAVAASLSLAWPGTAVAPTSATSPVSLLYTFDRCAAAGVDCTRLIPDGSGRANDGTVRAVPGGGLRLVPGRHGYGLLLSGALIALDPTDDAAFNPGTRPFAYGATVKVDSPFTADANLMQRGRFSETTDQWKLQLDAGRQGCVVKGDKGRVTVFAPTDVAADGRWHSVICVITEKSVAYVVDGRVHRVDNTAGAITFTDPELLHVGGVFNSDGTINDPFPKPFDDVFFAG